MLSRFCHIPSITNLVPSSEEAWALREHPQSWRSLAGSAVLSSHICSSSCWCRRPCRASRGPHFPQCVSPVAHCAAYSSKSISRHIYCSWKMGEAIWGCCFLVLKRFIVQELAFNILKFKYTGCFLKESLPTPPPKRSLQNLCSELVILP